MPPKEQDQLLWSQIDTALFFHKADSLINNVYEIPNLVENDYPKQRDGDLLSFYEESKLAGDFAFIASDSLAPGSVTATTVEAKKDGSSLVLRLAANAGIEPKVESSIAQILTLLGKVSNHGATQDNVENVFDTIIQLNRNKLFFRLGSRHYVRENTPKDISSRLLSENLQGIFGEKDFRKFINQYPEFVQNVTGFGSALKEMEAALGKRVDECLKQVVKLAFNIYRHKSPSSRQRIIERFQEITGSEKSYILQVSQVARYFQIANGLVYLAQLHPSLFKSANLAVIPQSPKIEGRTVHAEVQLIIFYEQSGVTWWPRAIASSKKACYLCANFIRFHNRFLSLTSHGKLYSLWTVPNIKFPSGESLLRVVNAFNQLNKDLDKLMKSGVPRKRSSPHESITNLTDIAFRAPSVIAFGPSKTEEKKTGNDGQHILQTGPGGIQLEQQGHQADLVWRSVKHISRGIQAEQQPKSDQQSPEYTSKGIQVERQPQTTISGLSGSTQVVPYAPKGEARTRHYKKDWLDLFVVMDNLPIEDPLGIRQTIKLELPDSSDTREIEASQIVSLNDLQPGQEISIPTNNIAQFSFLIRYAGKSMRIIQNSR